jgi:hypothetical protein
MNLWVPAAQLSASQEGLRSMKLYLSCYAQDAYRKEWRRNVEMNIQLFLRDFEVDFKTPTAFSETIKLQISSEISAALLELRVLLVLVGHPDANCPCVRADNAL